jgi:hypothetical protein
VEFTPLERAVLDWIAEHTGDAVLARQIAEAKPVAREFTGSGSYTELEFRPGDAPPLTGGLTMFEPEIESPQLEHGAGSVLHCKSGFVSTLELYTNGGEPLPEVVSAWTLR